MKPQLKFHASRMVSHVGFPNGLCIRWGYVACGLKWEWRWVLAISVKFRWIDYSTGFSVSKPSAS